MLLDFKDAGRENVSNCFPEENQVIIGKSSSVSFCVCLCIFVRFLSKFYGHTLCVHTHTCMPYMHHLTVA